MTPRPAPRWPPVTATASIVSCRNSSANWRNWVVSRRRRSVGVWIWSSNGVFDETVTLRSLVIQQCVSRLANGFFWLGARLCLGKRGFRRPYTILRRLCNLPLWHCPQGTPGLTPTLMSCGRPDNAYSLLTYVAFGVLPWRMGPIGGFFAVLIGVLQH